MSSKKKLKDAYIQASKTAKELIESVELTGGAGDIKEELQQLIKYQFLCNQNLGEAIEHYEKYVIANNSIEYQDYIKLMADVYNGYMQSAYLVDQMIVEADNYEYQNSGNATYSGKVEIDARLVDNMQFEVTDESGIIHIQLNKALPHKGLHDKGYTAYNALVHRTLELQFEENRTYKKVYMVFIHHYMSEGKSKKRDVDNYEEGPLSNAIARHFIKGGDGPDNVRRLSIALLDKQAFTDVFLVPFEHLSEWLTRHENYTK